MIINCVLCEELTVKKRYSKYNYCEACNKKRQKQQKKELRDSKKPKALTDIKVNTYRIEKQIAYCQFCKIKMHNLPIKRQFCSGKCQGINLTLKKLYTYYLLISIYNSKVNGIM